MEAPWSKGGDVEVFAFVTGSLRNHFEKLCVENSNSPELQEILCEVTNIFTSGSSLLARPVSDVLDFDIPGKREEGKEHGSYLLPQDFEARMEFEGSATLYLQAYKGLPRDKRNVKLEVVASLGIGVASSQFFCPNAEVLKFVGIEKPEVVFIGESIAKECNNPPRLTQLIGRMFFALRTDVS